mmetsp:Transcript_18122/g.39577  ORF Transcript_18122/g.39577 Transcript_18122/m.39577 type:complete len:122 (-) Transcript_18122:2287-2652(-)
MYKKIYKRVQNCTLNGGDSPQRTVESYDEKVTDQCEGNYWEERGIHKVCEYIFVNNSAYRDHTVANDTADGPNKCGEQSAVDECIVEFHWCGFGHNARVDALQDYSAHEDSREEGNVNELA